MSLLLADAADCVELVLEVVDAALNLALSQKRAEAVREADETGGTAVICSPMSTWDVYAVAAEGERVPRKSTSFGPKPRTGLVIRTFAQG